MRIALLSFPNSAVDDSLMLAVRRAGMELHLLEPLDKIEEFSGFIINGIFQVSDSVMQAIKLQSKLGKPILGMGAGAVMLMKMGLVPGLENEACCMSIAQSGINATHIRLADFYQLNAFTRHLNPKTVFSISATQECFVVPPALLMEMQVNGMDVFHYVEGNAIAAVANKMGNVIAIIPPIEVDSADGIFQAMRDYILCHHVPSVLPMNYYSI